jgi:hypothetical protein
MAHSLDVGNDLVTPHPRIRFQRRKKMPDFLPRLPIDFLREAPTNPSRAAAPGRRPKDLLARAGTAARVHVPSIAHDAHQPEVLREDRGAGKYRAWP